MSLISRFGKLFQVSYVARDLDLAMELARRKMGIEDFHIIDAEYSALVRGQVRDLKLRAAIANTDKHQFEIIQPVSGAIEVYTDGIDYDRSGLAFHHVGVAVTGPFSNWEQLVAEVNASDDEFAVICPPDLGSNPKACYAYADTRSWCGHYTEYLWWAPEMSGNPAFPDLS